MKITTYDYIDSNRRKTILLVLVFPVSLLLLIFIALFIYSGISLAITRQLFNENIIIYVFRTYWYYLVLSIILSALWALLVFYRGNQIVLNYLNARITEDHEYRDTKKIIENISITAGIKAPKLYIMEAEMSLNVFTVGTSINNSCIVLTFGIIKQLDRTELEAVIAHEVAHIINRDTILMMAIMLMTGFFTFFGSFLMYGISLKRTNKGLQVGKSFGILILIGSILYIYGNFIAPTIRFAVSRTREFHADANSALLTRNPQGLISALKKIDRHPIIDYFNSNEIMAPLCVVSPLRIPISLFDSLSNLSRTHPPIQDRIQALQVMDGQHLN